MSQPACPRCQEEVSLPLGASRQALVECPFCLERYTLDEVLKGVPPTLTVIDDPEADLVPVGSSEDVPLGMRTGDVASLLALNAPAPAASKATTGAPAFDFREAGSATGAAPRSAVSASPRVRRKPRNPLVELVKIVGGGLLAFPLAILLLWWVFGVDRFEVGPKVAKIPMLKFLVPKDFRGEDTELDLSSAPNDTPPAKAATRRATGSSGGSAGKRRPSATGVAERPDAAGEPAVDSAGDTEEQAGDNQETKMSQGVRNAPKFTADEFDDALLSANQAREEQAVLAAAQEEETADERAAAERKTYDALAKLAHVTTYLDLQDFAHRDRAQKLEESLRAAAETSEQRKPLMREAAKALADPATRDGEGVVILGVVKSIDRAGPLFVTEIDPNPAQQDPPSESISVYSRLDPSERCPVGKPALVLGAFVADPGQNLDGYQGDEKEVIWGGFPVSF